MNCIHTSKKLCNPQCKYCVYFEEHLFVSREQQIQKLQGLKTVLIKKLLRVEKQLLHNITKGGE